MSVQETIYSCTPRQTRAFIEQCFEANLVPFVQSSPGMGKSSIFKSVAEDYGLRLIDHRATTAIPEDFSGLPEFYDVPGTNIRKARFVPFDVFPTEEMEVPPGYEGWLLFLDEFNQGTSEVQAAAYKLLLDRMVAQQNIHPNVAIGLAGNLDTDRAITNKISTALQSRVVHIKMVVNHNEWLEDVALAQNYDERVIGFLSWKKEALMDFDPNHSDSTFACPRTWEFVNRIVDGRDIPDEMANLLIGTVGKAHAPEFVQFAKLYKTLTTIKHIVNDPTGIPIPSDQQSRWAVVSHLMGQTDASNMDKVVEYIMRLDNSLKILFFKGLLIRKPTLRDHPAFLRGTVNIHQHLYGHVP